MAGRLGGCAFDNAGLGSVGKRLATIFTCSPVSRIDRDFRERKRIRSSLRDCTSARFAERGTLTGAGMSKEILQHVFEPFFTTKKAGEGTGLGLSQVYGFVKESKGHIEVDSKPGQGTTVMIYLPALPGNVPAERTAEPEIRPAGSPPTILLVEDDHDVRAYVGEILRELNYQVLEAHDAESALAQLPACTDDFLRAWRRSNR